jgi:hypothetical protein
MKQKLRALSMEHMLGIRLQKEYCAVENKIPKSRNELYEKYAKNNAILK